VPGGDGAGTEEPCRPPAGSMSDSIPRRGPRSKKARASAALVRSRRRARFLSSCAAPRFTRRSRTPSEPPPIKAGVSSRTTCAAEAGVRLRGEEHARPGALARAAASADRRSQSRRILLDCGSQRHQDLELAARDLSAPDRLAATDAWPAANCSCASRVWGSAADSGAAQGDFTSAKALGMKKSARSTPAAGRFSARRTQVLRAGKSP